VESECPLCWQSLFTQTQNHQKDPLFRSKNQLSDKPIIALLPGSRKQEIKRMLPNMLELSKHYPNYQFVVAGSPGLTKDFYIPFLIPNSTILFGATREILANSEAAVVCSGTASLETALYEYTTCLCLCSTSSYLFYSRFGSTSEIRISCKFKPQQRGCKGVNTK
jgi:lipid-A-disaccharide synthase